MPQPPYVRTTLRVDGGPIQTGALTIPGGNAVTLRLENSIAIQNIRWEVYGYPDGFAPPAGWTLDAESRKILSADLEPTDLQIPDTGTLWGKWLVDVYANGGTLSERGVSGVQTLSPGSGLSATAPGEENQFGGVPAAVEGNWRLLDGGGGGGGPGTLGGDVTGAAGANTVSKIRGKTVATSVATPTLGQIWTYTSAGEYGLTPFPSAKGQVLYWHQGNGNWALTAAPTAGQVLTASGDTPTWAAPVDPTAAQVVGLGSQRDVPVAGGSQVIVAADWAYSVLRFLGSLPDHSTFTLQGVTGRRTLLINATDELYWLAVAGSGGGLTYLAPGQAKEVWTDSAGVLRGPDLKAWVWEREISMVGASGADIDTQAVLPPRHTLCGAVLAGLVDKAGAGSAVFKFGTTAGGTEILTQSAVGATQAHGDNPDVWGPALQGLDNYSASARTLTIREEIRSGSVTAGSLRATTTAVLL